LSWLEDDEEEELDDKEDELDNCPFPLDEAPTTLLAGVVAGGDGVASLSTLLARLRLCED
jgi:hypothetical protein